MNANISHLNFPLEISTFEISGRNLLILLSANYTKLNDHSGDVKTPVQPSYVKSKICLSAFRNPVLQDGAGATAFHQVKIVRITRDENPGRVRHETNKFTDFARLYHATSALRRQYAVTSAPAT